MLEPSTLAHEQSLLPVPLVLIRVNMALFASLCGERHFQHWSVANSTIPCAQCAH